MSQVEKDLILLILCTCIFNVPFSEILQAIDKYYAGISPNHWLPWIPQLLICLARREGQYILNLLCSVGKAYPQAVYFPIRTLYLTLKMEQKEKCNNNTIFK